MGANHSKDENLPEQRRFFAQKKFPRLIKKSSSDQTEFSETYQNQKQPENCGSSSSGRRMSLGGSGSYPYPRGHKTLLVPVGKGTSRFNDDDHPLKKPAKFQRGGRDSGYSKSFGRRFFKSGSANLHIPSPVLSCSEPSTADNSLSVSRSETNEFPGGAVENLGDNAENIPVLSKGDGTKGPSVAEQALSSLKIKDIYDSSIINTTQTAASSSSSSSFLFTEKAGGSNLRGSTSLMSNDLRKGNKNNDECATVFPYCSSFATRAPKKSILKSPPQVQQKQSSVLEYNPVKENVVVLSESVASSNTSRIARPTNFKAALPKFKCTASNLSTTNTAPASDQIIAENLSEAINQQESDTLSSRLNDCLQANFESRPFINNFKRPPLKKGGFAPLAESESFTIENSPAVELPPAGQLYAVTGAGNRVSSKIMPPPKSSNLPRANLNKISFKLPETGKETGKPGLSKPVETGFKPPSGLPTKRTTNFAESRLKNLSSYSKTQHMIYGKFDKQKKSLETAQESEPCDKEERSEETVFVVTDENANSMRCKVEEVAAMKSMDDSKPAFSENVNAGPNIRLPKDSPAQAESPTYKKLEMVDSGVKSCDSSLGSDASVSNSNSKIASPDGSVHRGLIDDEIRDQPDLTVGTQTEQASLDQTLTTVDNISACSEKTLVGPIRHRSQSIRRSVVDRMTESCDSTISSAASVDGDDLMLDFDARFGDSANEMSDSYHSMSNYKPQKPVGLRRLSSLKRTSTEGVMDEYNRLVNEIKNSSQSRNNLKSSTADLTTGNNVHRPLKFPTPISEDLANSVAPIVVDPHTYRHLVQDVTVVKTLLFRLKRVLQEADTVNPFESALAAKNGYLKQSLDELISDSAVSEFTKEDFREENSALRTQIALMRQQLEEKESVIAEQKIRIEELERLCKLNSAKNSGAATDRIKSTSSQPFIEPNERLPDLLASQSDVT